MRVGKNTSAMFLKHVRLSGFRAFTDFEMNFQNGEDQNRKLTLVIGENGTGKTNLLKAIALVTAGSDALGELIGKPEAWIQNGSPQCEIAAVITTAEGEERELTLRLQRGNNLRDIFQNNGDTLSRIDRAIAHADRNYFVIALGASRRMADGSRYRTPENFYETRRANNMATLFNRDANLTSLENWAADLDYRDDQKARDVVQMVLHAFMPSVTYDGIDRRTRRLMFNTPNRLVPLDQLSEGYQNIATWVGDIVYRITNQFPDYKQPLTARGLLLLDEIGPAFGPALATHAARLFPKRAAEFPDCCHHAQPAHGAAGGSRRIVYTARHRWSCFVASLS